MPQINFNSRSTNLNDSQVSTRDTDHFTDLTAHWLRAVQSHRHGTYDSLFILQDLRDRASLFSGDLLDCIQPVIIVLDELFASNKLFSPRLEPALKQSFQRLDLIYADVARRSQIEKDV